MHKYGNCRGVSKFTLNNGFYCSLDTVETFFLSKYILNVHFRFYCSQIRLYFFRSWWIIKFVTFLIILLIILILFLEVLLIFQNLL